MKKIDYIKGVGHYSIINNILYYVKDEYIFSGNKQYIIKLNDFWGVTFSDKIINVFTSNSHNTFYNYDGKFLTEYSNINFYHIFSENEFLYFDRINKNSKYNNKIFFKGKIGRHIIVDDRLYFEKNGIIKCINYKDQKSILDIDISSFGLRDNELKIDKFIGFFQEQVLVVCKNNAVLSIHKHSGELLNKWLSFSQIQMDEYQLSEIPYGLVMQLDNEKGKVIGFNFFAYWEIDLSTHEIKSKSLSDTLKQNDLFGIKNLTGFAHNETHYFLTAESNFRENLNRRQDSLIAINKLTLDIDWKYEFGEHEALGVNIPQYGNNKLYQLDWDSNLHIFQKDDSIS